MSSSSDFGSTEYMYPNTDPTMHDLVGEALIYQRTFMRSTTPMEMADWEYKNLQKFKIDTENIDRCYYVKKDSRRSFIFLGRLKSYEDKNYPIFVELWASSNDTSYGRHVYGTIYLTRHAQIYYDVVSKNNTAKVKKALELGLGKDGYEIRETIYQSRENFDISTGFRFNPPQLKFLCHQAVHENKIEPSYYNKLLPKILANSISDFILRRNVLEKYDFGDEWIEIDDIYTDLEAENSVSEYIDLEEEEYTDLEEVQNSISEYADLEEVLEYADMKEEDFIIMHKFLEKYNTLDDWIEIVDDILFDDIYPDLEED